MAVRRKRNHTLRFKPDLWGQWELPNVESEAGTTDMWGTLVSEMQSDVEVNGCYITGELNYLTTGQLVTDWGEGYFIALKLTDIGDNLTDVKVGLTPSAGSGLVSIDSDANVVCHITDKNTQKFTVWATDGVTSRTNYYDLSGLTLNEEPPTPQGVVLFDGTVTLLDNDGEGLYAPVSISEPLVFGSTVTMTFGSESFTGTVTEPSPNVLAVLFDEEGTINIGTIESDTMIGVPYSMGTEGETVAVKVVQS